MKIDTRTLRQPLSPLRWALLLLLPALLSGCEHQTAYSMMVPWSADEPPRIWYWETRETAPVIGSQLCEPLEQDTGEEVYTCRVPVLRGSDVNPVILAVSEGEALEVKRWDFPDEWDPPNWPFQLEHPGNTVGDIQLSRTDDMYQQVVPLNGIQWRLTWDAEDPPPLEAWVVFRVATFAGGDPLEVALYYDGALDQPWREAGVEGETTSRCAGQRAGGGTSEVPCYLPAPPLGEAYQVDVWLRGADRAVETISLSRNELVAGSETPLGCPGMTEGPYTLYYLDRNGNGDGDPKGEPVAACGDVDGYVPNAEDCEGEVCETSSPSPEVTPTPLPASPPTPAPDDLDQDSFSPAQGDCNDGDPLVHPGAEDLPDDGIDQDCGGLDGPQPHVGLNEQSARSIQSALDAAPDEPAVVVWVGPGIYNEYEVTFLGKAMRLKSTHGQKKTIIDAQQKGTVMIFGSDEAGDTTVEGFTLTGGHGEYYGGGMTLEWASPTLTHLTLTGNFSNESGGGMSLLYSYPTLFQVTLTGNSTASTCGGMSLENSSPALTDVTLIGNSAIAGGGMCLYLSSPTLKQVTFTGNSSELAGGAMTLGLSSPTLTRVTLTGNTVTSAGGVGGGMYLYDSSPVLINSILAYNNSDVGGNLYQYIYEGTVNSVSMVYSNLYNPPSFATDTLTPSGRYLTVEPMFLSYATSNGSPCPPGSSTSCLPSDFHLALDSPLINAGDPAFLDRDPDGSRSDIGSYGGPDGDAWDLDGDILPDYFWPGTWYDAPEGFEPTDFDCDDLDPKVGGCP